MDSDLIMINQYKNIKLKSFSDIMKLKNIIHIIFFIFGIILIIFFIFNNKENQKLLKQILKDINSKINGKSLFTNSYKDKDVKNRINLLKIFTNNNPYIYKHMEDCLLNGPDKLFCFYHFIYPKKVIGKKEYY